MFGELKMPTFVEQMQVDIAKQWPEGVRVLGFLDRTRPGDAEQIGLRAVHPADEQPRRGNRREPSERGATPAGQHLDGCRAWQEGAHDEPHRGVVRTEHAERVTQCPIGERFGHALRQAGQIGHVVHDGTFSPINCVASCARPRSGTSIQVGRFDAS